MRLDLPLIAPLSVDRHDLMEKRIRFLWSAGVRIITLPALHPQTPRLFEKLTLIFGESLRFGLHDICDPEVFISFKPLPIALAVMPHTDVALIKAVSQKNIPTMVGVFTISEIRQAVQAGADMLHIYPIQGLPADIMPTFMRFIPHTIRCFGSGLITEKDLPSWIRGGMTGVIPEGLFDLQETPEGLAQQQAISFISSLKLAFKDRNKTPVYAPAS